MSRSFFSLILLAAIGAPLAATPAAAQFPDIFGTIFGQPQAPRPPENVPGRQPQQYPQQQYPQQQYPQQQYPQRYPQQQQYPQQRMDVPPQTLQQPGPPSRSRPQQGNIESEPLPPPPGSTAAPDTPPAGGFQPAQRQPRGTPQQQPGDAAAAPAPNDEVAIEPPREKVVNPTAVFAGLDKITGRITNFDVAMNETVQFGALQVTPRACYTRPPTDTPHTDAFIEVDEVTLQGEIRRVYTGWMFAASPGLHAVEHPIYDIWLTDCKGGAVAEAAPEPDAQQPRPTRSQQQQRQPAAQQRQPAAQPQRRAPQQPF